MAPEILEDWFPNLKIEGWKPKSPEDENYNCIAFAADDENQKWDPDDVDGRYWPDGLPRNLELETFVKLYESECGYSSCENSDVEDGFEKIAIYWNFNPNSQKVEVTHAAKQLPSGIWISKLGGVDDIEHNTLKALEGSFPAYGTVAKFMKRPRKEI